ncbi:acyl-CoA thioesterase [Panacagrimonas sp.]|uniref:acyl-CoA thioesterase n=1 Tax=Panacagrimonas sp. TaxID=2480088 RepID=UPI003B52CEBF
MTSSPPLIWDVPAPFVQTITVSEGHLDEFGHTNNVVYLSWLQDVAWAHSVSLGFGMAEYRRIGAGCVARRHELDYLAATHAGDLLHVATWIAENSGKVDMWRAYQILRAQDGKTVLRGRTHWICVDMLSGRPRRQPAEFIAAYRPAVSSFG